MPQASTTHRTTTADDPQLRASRRAYIAGEVRAALARANINQRDLSEIFDTSAATINRRIKGHVAFDTDELMHIADLTGVPVTAFFPALDSTRNGPLAQLVESRTFNPKSERSLHLILGGAA